MLRIIWIGIKNWVYNDFNEALPRGDDVSIEEFEKLKIAYKAQTDIGWKHFLVGRTSKKWSVYYATRILNDEKKDGKVIAFGRTLIESIWKYTLNVWTMHNETVHVKKTQVLKKET